MTKEKKAITDYKANTDLTLEFNGKTYRLVESDGKTDCENCPMHSPLCGDICDRVYSLATPEPPFSYMDCVFVEDDGGKPSDAELDLASVLRDCPTGTKLYSPLFGEVVFSGISDASDPSVVKVDYTDDEGKSYTVWFQSDGRYIRASQGECLLFPSKDNREWSTFKAPDIPLPRTWDEYRANNSIAWCCNLALPMKYFEAVEALVKLVLLRDSYNGDWRPDWKNADERKWCIYAENDVLKVSGRGFCQRVLAFKTYELCEEFIQNFGDLIEIAKPLI